MNHVLHSDVLYFWFGTQLLLVPCSWSVQNASSAHWWTELQLQVENAEVQKQKYKNRTTYRCLVAYWLTTVEALYPKGYFIRSMWEPDLEIQNCCEHRYHNACDCQWVWPGSKWANHVGSMLQMFWQWCRCECCHSFSARISPITQPVTKVLLRYCQIVIIISEWNQETYAVSCYRLC